MTNQPHIIIAGGGFAGLTCAKALAARGVAVTLLERKKAAGVGMHTTGIIVKECADEFAVPDDITRKVTNVRLYAPSLRHVDLKSSDYFFLTTDTPRLMQFFTDEAANAGAKIIFDTAYDKSEIVGDKVVVNGGAYSADFLIGADGPRSKVAADYSLGKNTEFLLGAEAEYTGLKLHDENAFYCFLDQKLAHGYLGWVIPSVGVAQVGLAQRMPARPDIDAFVSRMKDISSPSKARREAAGFGAKGSSLEQIFDFSEAQVVARRGGLIPCGGLVRPFANERVILLGDAAGIVSPLTAGGIHTALRYGRILGETLADYFTRGGAHPAELLEKIYPRFYAKLAMRKIFEHTPNALIDFGITNPLFAMAAGQVFYRKKKLR